MKCDKLFKEALENIIRVDSSQAANSQKLPGKLSKLGKLEDIPVDFLRQMLDIANEKDPNGTLAKAIKAEISKRPLTMPAKPFDYDTIEPIVPGAGTADIALKGIPTSEVRGTLMELQSYNPTVYNQKLIANLKAELKARQEATDAINNVPKIKDIYSKENSLSNNLISIINSNASNFQLKNNPGLSAIDVAEGVRLRDLIRPFFSRATAINADYNIDQLDDAILILKQLPNKEKELKIATELREEASR